MFEISTLRTFDAAHRLSQYNGKCKDIHGHTYTVTVFFEGSECDLNSLGMLLDFSRVDRALDEVTTQLDHTLLLDEEDKLLDTLKIERHLTLRYTTAEYIAKYIFDELVKILSHDGVEVLLSRVSVAETPRHVATYYRQTALSKGEL